MDAGGVVDDDFGSAYFGHGNFEDSGEGTIIGHVRGVCVYGCGGGGGGDEGSITIKMGPAGAMTMEPKRCTERWYRCCDMIYTRTD